MKSYNDILNKIKIISESENKADNDVLYHYTDCSALVNILKDKEIWLSQREFMNDVFDRSYASKVLKEAFINVYGKNGENEYQNFIDRMIPEFDKHYVFSLTTEKDLMSQWAYYGGNDGYCLSFNRIELNNTFKNKDLGFSYGVVIYKKENQLKIFETLIEYIKNLESNISTIPPRDYIEEISKINSLLALFHVLTKQENNYSEKEVRIVINNPTNTHFRNRKGIILPYTKINFNEKKLPIKEIMMGPGINDVIALDGLKQYLESRKLKNIRLEKSTMQIR